MSLLFTLQVKKLEKKHEGNKGALSVETQKAWQYIVTHSPMKPPRTRFIWALESQHCTKAVIITVA